MPLRVYNTLTGQKERFEPVVPGKVGIYCCGPTVYMQSHVGHMVGPVIFDTIKRYFTYLGYQVTLVINITDIEDKLIQQAAKETTTVGQLAERVTGDYLANIRRLGVEGIDHLPRATENIEGILRITQGLIERGYAYVANGDVYFDVTRDEDYGKLSHRDPEALEAGARVEPSSLKRHPGDFALWKGAKPGEPAWDSPWGRGRPGWHIECSAMSMRYLGHTFDIHGGGLDLVFPHHENEIAQSESYTGKPFARYWLHNGLMQRSAGSGKIGGRARDGEPADQEAGKMSKSKGNIVTISDLLTRHPPETVRFFLVSTHYRRPIDFSDEHIAEVGRGLQAFYRFFERFQRITGKSFYALEAPERLHEFSLAGAPPEWLGEFKTLHSRFMESMDDDFNTSGAVAVLFDLLRTLNGLADRKELEGKGDAAARQAFERGAVLLRELSGILGVFRQPVEKPAAADNELTARLLDVLVDLRRQARAGKDFALADDIRKRLSELGVVLEDRPGDTGWRIER
jgi:cysteinyl-tRNA synthetase